ncbi:hypothetical protein JKP88DRAFT_283334 [Tribonema minus]|uniref:Uncharacterized protein n=1 Tax=Tribonema minus TaxID=303371 RepID=A0A835YIL6_9STRA|nr:hypothetical protein JKP88DRAFT_283334 [Tribonema minus]
MKSVASLILLVVCLALAMIGSVNAACLRGTSEGGDARSLRGANEAGKDSGSLRKLFTVGGATDCWGKDTYCLCGTSGSEGRLGDSAAG